MPHDTDNDRRIDPILLVVRELRGIREQIEQHNKNNSILCRMEEMEKRIMSAISDYSEAVDAKFAETGASVDELVTAIAGVSGDVASLKDIILKLENNPGAITPEDQALLTSGVVKVTALSERLKGVAAALKALDAATAPTEVPPAPENP